MSPAVIVGGVIGIAGLAVGGMWFMTGQPARLKLDPVEDQAVDEDATVSVTLKSQAEGLPPGEWTYGMISGPPGARVDAKAGVFTWKPSEDHGPGEHQVTVAVQAKGADQQLLRFYTEFIPMIPPKRGDDPSPHCMRMLERAIEKFTAAGQAPQAQVFAVQFAKLKASE